MNNRISIQDDGVALSGNKKAIILVIIGVTICGAVIAAALHWMHLYNPVVVFIASLIFISVFGGVAIYEIMVLIKNVPAIIVDGTGFTDNSNGPLSAGRVDWEQVIDVLLLEKQLQSFIAVRINNPEDYLHDKNILKSVLFRTNLSGMGAPIVISGGSLDMRVRDAYKIIRDRFDAFSEE